MTMRSESIGGFPAFFGSADPDENQDATQTEGSCSRPPLAVFRGFQGGATQTGPRQNQNSMQILGLSAAGHAPSANHPDRTPTR